MNQNLINIYNKEDIKNIIINISYVLKRERGISISPGKLSQSINIIYDYILLTKKEKIDINELSWILSSVLGVKIPPDFIKKIAVKKNQEDIRNKILNNILEILDNIGLKPGTTIKYNKLYKNKTIKEKEIIKKELYKLKLIGIIRYKNNKLIIYNKNMIKNIIEKLVEKGATSLDEIISRGKPKSKDEMLLYAEIRTPPSFDTLSKMKSKDLIRLGEAALKKNNKVLLYNISKELRRRLLNGEHVSDLERETRILKESGLLDASVLRTLIENGFVSPNIPPAILSSAVSSMDSEKAERIVSKYIKLLDNKEIFYDLLVRIPFEALARSKPPKMLDQEEAKLFKAAIEAAKALREAKLYTRDLSPARADMAFFYASNAKRLLESVNDNKFRSGPLNKRKISILTEKAEAIIGTVEALSGNYEIPSSLSMLVEIDPVLYSYFFKIYKNINLNKIITKYIIKISNTYGFTPLSSYKKTTHRTNRIDLRYTIYNIIRNKTKPIVYKSKEFRIPVVLVLDVSSSMSRYSVWSLIASLSLLKNIEYLILFNYNVAIFKGPFYANDISNILLKIGFYGRTNLSRALMEAYSLKTKSKKIIIISDLIQTVRDEPLENVAKKAKSKIKASIFLVPPHYDKNTYRMLREYGAKAIIVKNPTQAAKRLSIELRKR